VAQRNYLTVERRQENWQASWVFEDAGKTEPLAL
jgi:hypothetical protein